MVSPGFPFAIAVAVSRPTTSMPGDLAFQDTGCITVDNTNRTVEIRRSRASGHVSARDLLQAYGSLGPLVETNADVLEFSSFDRLRGLDPNWHRVSLCAKTLCAKTIPRRTCRIENRRHW